jgi:hypothetical protein
VQACAYDAAHATYLSVGLRGLFLIGNWGLEESMEPLQSKLGYLQATGQVVPSVVDAPV